MKKLNTIFFLSFFVCLNFSFAQTTNWTGTDGNWDVASNWDNGIPDATKSATVNGSGKNVTIPAGYDAIVRDIDLKNGATLTVAQTASLQISGSNGHGIDVRGGGTFLYNHGTVNANDNIDRAGVYITFGGKIQNEATGIFNVDNAGVGGHSEGFGMRLQGQFRNYGILNVGLNSVQGAVILAGVGSIITESTGQTLIAGSAPGADGISESGSVNSLTVQSGGILCIEDSLVDGDLIHPDISFTNNGTFNTFGCSSAAIPTMGELSLIHI